MRTHAHLEYENGFLIFDRFDSDKEVWRLSTDLNPSEIPVHASPDNRQLNAGQISGATYPTSRARFKPWCLIHTLQPTFAYRFSYPTLAVVSIDAAYLWDLTSATLVQIIHIHNVDPFDNDHDHDDRTTTSYVDVSAQHLFICMEQELRILNRSDGSLAFRIHSQSTFAKARVLLAQGRRDTPNVVVPIKAQVLAAAGPRNMPLPSFVAGMIPSASLTAATSDQHLIPAHVSKCGRHLVALLSDNRLLLIEDFERVARGDVSLANAALELYITLPRDAMPNGVYLAYEFGRVSVITVRRLPYFRTASCSLCTNRHPVYIYSYWTQRNIYSRTRTSHHRAIVHP